PAFLHRARLARPGRACARVPVEGQPGGGCGSAPAAELDGRERQRPLHGGGRGRGAGGEPSLGDGDGDQGDEGPELVVRRWSVLTVATAWGKPPGGGPSRPRK